MTDADNEEILEGPRVSSALEFGGTIDKPRTRDNYWFRTFSTESEPGEGLIFRVSKRPRSRRDEEPHPTLRIMRENPNGMLFAKIKSGEIKVEKYNDYINRQILQAQDEEAKEEEKK